ncbi:late competence development ComFB family protein [Cohnella nanjingensis]|uniref:Late competence development ComFB family protein n=1 Tax=Cohnella nanjingensis TaxID=1387779 RepID=A0A7X0RX34_9BACL|nr:late competence development ComFB family protein [Cohnella nanjingensis]MBB6673684.1 late competence development ComFB family protein [Cohnella nanjingensis]
MELSRAASVLNVMEPIVINTFKEHILTNRTLKCDCEKCRLDIVVLTLNHLQPHYTSTQAGEAYIKALFMNTQLQSDVIQELTRALQVVEDNPNH